MLLRSMLPNLAALVVASACYLALGSIPAPGLAAEVAVPAHRSDRTEPLDSCLIGHWKVADYTSYMASLLKHLRGWTQSGEETFHFERLRSGKGVATVIAQHFTMTAVAQDTHLVWAVELQGDADAYWKTPRKGIVRYKQVFGNLRETLTIDGKSGTSILAGPFPNGSQAYTCSKTTLRLTLSHGRPPVILTRLRSARPLAIDNTMRRVAQG